MMVSGLQQELLLIEDEPGDALLFEEMLYNDPNNNFKLTHLSRVEDIAKLDKLYVYDAIILDMNLPGLSGIEAVEHVQKICPALPLIVLSGINDDKKALQTVSLGVQDYLVKGESSGEVVRRSIRYAVQRKRYEQKIAHLTQYDQLTGLYNTGSFNAALQKTVRECRKNDHVLALYMVDIDSFKEVNDLYGHDVGNSVLIEVASRLKSLCGDDHFAARLGNDEFVFAQIASNITQTGDEFAAQLDTLIAQPCYIGEYIIQVQASIGIATYPESGKDARSLLHHAQIALYRAKEQQYQIYEHFDFAFHSALMQRIQISSALRRAVENKEFTILYQPKICMRSNQVAGAEALLRWNHPELGMILPKVFIPIAEDAGLMREITCWVLDTACSDFQDARLQYLNLAINVSGKQFSNTVIVDMLKDILEDTKISPSRVQLELTETAVMHNVEQAMYILQALKQLGLAIHIDDFGTGYSSLDYLRRFPVDALKIDRSFISDIDGRHDDTFIRMIINLAHELSLEVIAEGVETKEQVSRLAALNCDVVQGYIYSKPIAKDDLIQWLKQRSHISSQRVN